LTPLHTHSKRRTDRNAAKAAESVKA
jgi:hypothetical protein